MPVDSSIAIPSSQTIHKGHSEERQQQRILLVTELCRRLSRRAGAIGGDGVRRDECRDECEERAREVFEPADVEEARRRSTSSRGTSIIDWGCVATHVLESAGKPSSRNVSVELKMALVILLGSRSQRETVKGLESHRQALSRSLATKRLLQVSMA